MLDELDQVFDGAPSWPDVRHIVQNWNDEPYAVGAYPEDDAPSAISASLAKPLGETFRE